MPNNATPQQSQSSGATTQKQSQERPKPSENEGEGSRSAARNYDKATEEYVKSGRVDPAAQEAEAALDGPEGDALRAAERTARTTAPDAPRRTADAEARNESVKRDERGGEDGEEDPEDTDVEDNRDDE